MPWSVSGRGFRDGRKKRSLGEMWGPVLRRTESWNRLTALFCESQGIMTRTPRAVLGIFRLPVSIAFWPLQHKSCPERQQEGHSFLPQDYLIYFDLLDVNNTLPQQYFKKHQRRRREVGRVAVEWSTMLQKLYLDGASGHPWGTTKMYPSSRKHHNDPYLALSLPGQSNSTPAT